MNGTWVERLSVDGSVEPVVGFSRMARIRSLAGLSLRDWADVFDVTHTTIKHWTASEPDRPKLERVLAKNNGITVSEDLDRDNLFSIAAAVTPTGEAQREIRRVDQPARLL